MAYEKLNLSDGTVLTEEHIGHIEAGIANSGGIGTVSDGCVASGEYSHAEGDGSKATANNSHAEGRRTKAYGSDSHAEGYECAAEGAASHAEGRGTHTTRAYQHVQGKYNIIDNHVSYAWGKYAHIVGNGGGDNTRSNAHTLDWDGNAWYAGYVEGTALILPSPNGTRWRITVDDTGALAATREE